MPDFPLLGLGDVKMPKTSTDGILQLTPRKKLNFSRESEEEKMVALTQDSFRETDIFRPPSSDPNEKIDTYRRIRLTRSGEVSHHRKPMPSITLNLQKGWHSTHSRSPRYLPRPVPIVQNKSRSLFDISTDPLEGILRADAIAEAGRIYEPLTDEDDSDIEKDDDFFLCLPQAKEGMMSIPSPRQRCLNRSSHLEVVQIILMLRICQAPSSPAPKHHVLHTTINLQTFYQVHVSRLSFKINHLASNFRFRPSYLNFRLTCLNLCSHRS